MTPGLTHIFALGANNQKSRNIWTSQIHAQHSSATPTVGSMEVFQEAENFVSSVCEQEALGCESQLDQRGAAV